MSQWSGQQQSNSWANNMSPRQGAAMYPPSHPPHIPPQSHQKASDTKRPPGGAGKSNVEMQPEAYQRTLEYVQQCQSWSSNSVMSPDSTGAKQKSSSPPHSNSDGAAMPPPPPAPGANMQDNSTNMVIGDMTSSINLLNEENRFLHLMQ